MAFIAKADIEAVIRTAELDQITQSVDAKLDAPIAWAEAIVASKLRHKYNVNQILTETGANRDVVLVNITVALALYKAHLLINPRNVPELRYDEKESAIKQLNSIRDSKDLLDLPLKDADGKRGFKIRHGSRGTKFNKGNFY